jgi:hypothetical protein
VARFVGRHGAARWVVWFCTGAAPGEGEGRGGGKVWGGEGGMVQKVGPAPRAGAGGSWDGGAEQTRKPQALIRSSPPLGAAAGRVGRLGGEAACLL